MPRTTAEPLCNMTLSRNEWSVLVRLLESTTHPCSIPVRQAIRTALNADLESASVTLERDLEKWKTVLQAVYAEALRRGGEYNRLLASMTEQISRAEFGRR